MAAFDKTPVQILAELAVNDPQGFAKIVAVAKGEQAA